MSIEERNIAANIQIMNDKISGRCVLSYKEFAEKVSVELPGLKVKVSGIILPIAFSYTNVPGKNYYLDFIKLRYGL